MAHEAKIQAPTPAPLRACAWVRVSTKEQAESGRAGLDRQKEAVARVIESKGYLLVESIELIDVSGTAILHAPETIALLERMARREIDVIVAAEFSRIIRPDDLSTFSFLEECKQNGVLLDCGGAISDLASAEGYLGGGIQALLGGYERLQILRKMMAAKEMKRKRGQNPGSAITLPRGIGYNRKSEQYLLTSEIDSIIEAFRLIDEEGLRNLTEVARRTGIHARNVRNLLRLPIYRGERVYDKMRDTAQKQTGSNGRQMSKRKIARPAEKVIRVRIFDPSDQPVSDERWYRVQDVLNSIRENHAVFVAERHVGNLLAGTGRCGFCAKRIYAKTRNRLLAGGLKDTGFYICRSHHESMKTQAASHRCSQGWNRKVAMDALAEAFVTRFLADPEYVAALLEEMAIKQGRVSRGGEVEASRLRQMEALNERDARLIASMEAGAISPDELKQRRALLLEEKRRLLSSMARENAPSIENESKAALVERIVGRTAEWPKNGTVKEKKAFMIRTFSEVYFRGETITAFRFAPGVVDVVGQSGDRPTLEINPPISLKPVQVDLPIPDGFKRCSKCREIKATAKFYQRLARCRECHNAESKARYQRKRLGENTDRFP